jgi:hypothetical protein
VNKKSIVNSERIKPMNLDQMKLTAVVEAALANVQGQSRWINAIRKAADELTTNPYMHWTGDALLMLSDSGHIYTAHGSCQCKAYLAGIPCRHRAAARLVKRYLEATN